MPLKRGFMASPEYFDVLWRLPDNLAMDPNRRPDKALALRDWNNLLSTLQSRGVTVEVVPSVDPRCSDFTFVANAGLPIPKTTLFVLSNFCHPERRPETPYWRQYFEKRYEVIELAENEIFEGCGDAFWWDEETLFIAYGIRTNACGARKVKAVVREVNPRIKVEFLAMRTPFEILHGSRGIVSLYHRDVCLFAGRRRRLFIVYAGAFLQGSIKTLQQYGAVVLASDPQTYNFLGNSIEVSDDTIIVPWMDDITSRVLRTLGYRNQIVCPTAQFHLSGAGPACLFLEG